MKTVKCCTVTLFSCATVLVASIATFGQQAIWSLVRSIPRVETERAVQRHSFPTEFKVFALDAAALQQSLSSAIDKPGQSTVVTLPNADGKLEQFELFEASNFEPELQAKFPEIRAFSGRGITDRFATVKVAMSPRGVQGTVFRAASGFLEENGLTEIIEPYSADQKFYAVFKSARRNGELPWACKSPVELSLFSQWKGDIESKIATADSNTREIRVMRLAQSCNGEYANYFGATNSSQVANVLAGFNATLTRANGVYEKDLGIHMNLIPQTTDIIFYDPATDPYSDDLSNWNGELAGAIASKGISPEMYDIGHMFGASGGGGNAGCIGCVCSTNHDKGMGITSPADSHPEGDNFDIDYVVHEVGHQLGANHTFSYGQLPVPEQMGQDKEVGSGVTIMGYAGVGVQSNVAVHSIDSYHATSIGQIQENLSTRGCPTSGIAASTNRPPVVTTAASYTIPVLTPFKLTGSATDPDGDPLTYNWEQDDSSMDLGATLAYSSASPTKPVGPNWISARTTSLPTKIFPKLSTILAGQFITTPTEADPGMNSEALSAITRDLHFRLTVRDNHPYVPGSAIGQTQFGDTTVSVTNLAGPFKVAIPNMAATWVGGTTQTVVWLTGNTNLPPVSTANVNIWLSFDGGQKFAYLLKANTPNDGSEIITVPNLGTASARILVEAVGNIFFDVSDADVTIVGPAMDPASIAGRVATATGRSIKGAEITLTSQNGAVRTATTNASGTYTFADIPVGETYTITARNRRYSFTPATLTYNHVGQNSQQNFTAEPQDSRN